MLKTIAKAILPKFARREILTRLGARKFREVYFGPQLRAIPSTLRATGEFSNFTYDLTDRSLLYLAEILAVALSRESEEVEAYIREAIEDRELRAHLESGLKARGSTPMPPHVQCPFGRRLGWYAVARAIKPNLVVETGIDRGHGSILLCSALLRNATEGQPGKYRGTDIDPSAGWLLTGKYASVGKILYGDSIESLRKLDEPIDLFINDSDHSAEYEAREYQTVAPMLSERAIVLGDNAHVTSKLAEFSREAGRRFLMFKEEPKYHWYPGAGIGISFPLLERIAKLK